MNAVDLVWPAQRAAEALEALARRSGLVRVGGPPAAAVGGPDMARGLERAAGLLGLEIEPIESGYRDLDAALAGSAPALWHVPPAGGVVAVVRGSGRSLCVLDVDLRLRRIPVAELRQWLTRDMEASVRREVSAALDAAVMDERARPCVREALVCERLGHETIGGCWMLRLPPGAPFTLQLRQAGLIRAVAGLISLHALQQVFWMLSWWIVGASALLGRPDSGWLWAWALVVACAVLLRVQSTWTSGRLLYLTGGLLKRRMLAGILRLDAELLQRQGSGQQLGRLLESSAIEQMTLVGGFNAALSLIELVTACVVLALGPTPGVHLPLLAAWVGLAAMGTWRYSVHRRAWTASRLAVTRQLVERLAGHRTRIAQESPDRWHDGEDAALDDYVRASAGLDDSALAMSALVRTWVFVGLAGIIPALAHAEHPATILAVGIGGVLMAAQALARFNAGVGSLVGALIAGGHIRELYRSARNEPPPPAFELPPSAGDASLDVQGVRFQYAGQSEPVLHECTIRLHPRDRVLVEGPSGSGKSTLAKIIGGLLEPQAGLVLLDGLDRPSVGFDSWRRRVHLVPAVHENHILSGPLAFNVLLGHRWPPTPRDVELAVATCRELGLGPLLDRMPAGIMEFVGEAGWQLSLGEKSRVYVARALLSGSAALVLDESFGSLDPVTLRQCLSALLVRPHSILMIAHR